MNFSGDLTDDDIVWLWNNTFEGYRSLGLHNAYTDLHWRRIQRLAKDGKEKEAFDRARGDAWDLERRNAYLERNRHDSGRDDYRVEYGSWHADEV